MSILTEFRQFAAKGNVVDLAIGVVIGGAFGKIVSSLVADIITPIISLILGGVDFKWLTLILKPAVEDTPELAIRYGLFIQSIFDFLIISGSIFFFIKALNTLRQKMEREEKKEEAAVSPPPENIVLLREIRDLLKK